MMKAPKDIDAYIADAAVDVQPLLQKIRRTIKKASPKVEEVISYGIPAFELNGKRLVYFAAFKKHIGFYPPPPKAFKKEVARYAGPKGNLQFPLDEPMPLDLIKRIVLYKVKEISENKK